MAKLTTTARQLGLAVQLPDDENLATFIDGENSAQVAALTAFAESGSGAGQSSPWCLLTGASGVGKTHLLHALCAASPQHAMYLSLADIAAQAEPSVLTGLEQVPLLCLDDVEAVLQTESWCYALFTLLNKISDTQQSRVVMTSRASANQVKTALPDLTSRLQWGLPLQLQEMSDPYKVKALQLRAKMRGMELQTDVAQFMLQRLGRSMRSLMQCLAQLDEASLAAQRRLTIPFVKRELAI